MIKTKTISKVLSNSEGIDKAFEGLNKAFEGFDKTFEGFEEAFKSVNVSEVNKLESDKMIVTVDGTKIDVKGEVSEIKVNGKVVSLKGP